jgi:phage tail P2-like protein
LLPWLAWALGVGDWDPAQPEATRRGLIRGVLAIHRRRGTIGALKAAVASMRLDGSVTVTENPGNQPFTIQLEIETPDFLPDATKAFITRTVADAKNLRTHLLPLVFNIALKGGVYFGAAVFEERVVEVAGTAPLQKMSGAIVMASRKRATIIARLTVAATEE